MCEIDTHESTDSTRLRPSDKAQFSKKDGDRADLQGVLGGDDVLSDIFRPKYAFMFSGEELKNLTLLLQEEQDSFVVDSEQEGDAGATYPVKVSMAVSKVYSKLQASKD